MSDVVWLQIIQSVFWLLLVGGVIAGFRKELKKLLQSLGHVEVAGAAFQFGNKKETIRSYVLLSDTFVNVLSQTEKIEYLSILLTYSQVESLGRFALKYTTEVNPSEWNEELLRNIAHLLLRSGRYTQSVDLLNILLEKRPNHADLLNLKGLALMTSRVKSPVMESEKLYEDLVSRFPEVSIYRFNYALALSLSEKVTESVREMRKAIELGYWKINENMLDDGLFYLAREKNPGAIEKLNKDIQKFKNEHYNNLCS